VKQSKFQTHYKYLGVDLVSNVSDWTRYIRRIIQEATHLSESLSWLCRRESGLRARSASTLWQAIVRPVLEYASEIWAGNLPTNLVDDVERIQTNFARSVLGLVGSQSIPNDLIRAEMGMEKLSCRWEKLRLGYWRRINVASRERTLAAVVSLRRRHLAWDYPGSKRGWMCGTRGLLTDVGLVRFWSDPDLCRRLSKEEWKQTVYDAVERAEDIARRNRLAGMSSKNVCRYARIKRWAPIKAEFACFTGEIGRRGALVHEPYLDDYSEQIGRRLKLMCRMRCLSTLSRVVREENLPISEARCRSCVSSSIEDITHLLMECPAYSKHREKLVKDLDLALDTSSLENWKFSSMSTSYRLDLLLGRSTGSDSGRSR